MRTSESSNRSQEPWGEAHPDEIVMYWRRVFDRTSASCNDDDHLVTSITDGHVASYLTAAESIEVDSQADLIKDKTDSLNGSLTNVDEEAPMSSSSSSTGTENEKELLPRMNNLDDDDDTDDDDMEKVVVMNAEGNETVRDPLRRRSGRPEGARVSMPGAFAQPGPGAALLTEEDLEAGDITLSSHSTSEQQRINTAREETNPRNSNTADTVQANLVDDAEPVFYAKDVHQDLFKRRILWAGVALVFAGIVATILAVVLIDPENNDQPTGDPLCWEPVESQTVFVRCFCSNSTQGYYNEMTKTSKDFYLLFQFLPAYPEVAANEGVEGTMDRDSCEPLNQVLLHTANLQGLVTNIEDTKDLPPEALLSGGTLLLFYARLDGIHWHDSSHWTTSPTFCRWFGVGCILLDNLHELRLPNNGLVGEFPTSLYMLPELRTLDLSYNRIWGTIPTELSSLEVLNDLSLSQLNLTGPVPSELGALERLGSLSLHINQLSGNIPGELLELTELRILDLSHNALTGALPGSLSIGESQLSILRVNNNDLTGTLPPDMANLTKLELLNLGDNRLTGTLPDVLGEMPRLQFVNLYKSGLGGQIPDSFCNDTDRLDTDILLECADFEMCACCRIDGGGKRPGGGRGPGSNDTSTSTSEDEGPGGGPGGGRGDGGRGHGGPGGGEGSSGGIRIICAEDILDITLWTDARR